jgi:mRNA interferase RelE/StbE
MSANYQILIEHRAQRELTRLSSEAAGRVTVAIDNLMSQPRPPGCKKLSGSQNEWRVRVGDYRILYEIDDRIRRVRIYAIGHRREIYR